MERDWRGSEFTGERERPVDVRARRSRRRWWIILS